MQRLPRLLVMLAATWAAIALLVGCGSDPSDSTASAPGEPIGTEPIGTAEPPTAPVDEPTAEPVAEPEAELVDQADAEPLAQPDAEPVVYDNDFGTSIAPIFANHCASCHNAGGPGAAHWRLEEAGDLAATHEWIAAVVDTGFMPPWPAGPLSVKFRNDRGLSSDEVQAIVAWSADGGTLDVEPAMPITPPAPLRTLDFDIEIPPNEPYQGSTELVDDYRCLTYDPQLAEATWVAGFEFVPDQTQIVHHAVGYLVRSDVGADSARRLDDSDDGAGWQCYGGPRIPTEGLFVGWAPGQEATIYPEGAGFLMEPGDFFVIQIHYHYDADAPLDASSLRIDWSDADSLDRLDFFQLTGPAEIPCPAEETAPLCDRDAALARARDLYGGEGVLADAINRRCGVSASDFVLADDGTVSSTCDFFVDAPGEVISVFGHQHEIGKSIRLTLNAGQPDERILLDIPEWSFDWQLNYEPVETLSVERGDRVTLDCAWDRTLRSPDLEPAYVLWADGTNDEMCFATVTTLTGEDPRQSSADDDASQQPAFDTELELPDELQNCLIAQGVTGLPFPPREEIDGAVDALFECASPEEVGELLADGLTTTLDGLLSDEDVDCIASGLATPDGARDLLTFGLFDATPDERTPVAELVGDCVALSGVITEFGLPIEDDAKACVDEGGRQILVDAAIELVEPDLVQVFTLISTCQGE